MSTEKIPAKRIRTRAIRLRDYEAICALQLICFPGMLPWKKEQFESILKIFPEGQFCVEYNKQIVASSCSLIIRRNQYSATASWNELTDNGYIRNHDPEGDTLYGMEIMVHPDFRQMKLARRLYDMRKKLVKDRNLMCMLIGGRLPNYHKYAERMRVEQYVESVIDRKIYDPVLTAQLSNGFVLQRLLPNYLPNDKESMGYGTFLEWNNLLYEERKSRQHRKDPYVRVACIQYQMRDIGSFEEFAANCEYFVDVASDYRADFVAFPEMITMQLLTFLPKKHPAEAVRQLDQFTGQYIELFTQLAIKYNINIVAGSHFLIEDDNLYNVSFLFKRDGTYAKQYKIHITPHERKWWGVQPGQEVRVFDTDCGKVSIAICYDIEFPELARIATSKGARIIFVPFNTDERRSYLRVRYCSQARAIENQVYVVITGCVGNLPDVDNLDIHFAQSAILTPSDIEFHREGLAAEAPPNVETAIVQELDMNLLKRNREYGSVQPWSDRRLDLYQLQYQENNKTRQA
ncbi:MAG: GNAT family N-acetyltransferase [Chitinophagaceae bacterium]|jgi:predicted amidohydrolase/ribosomal protein S18 acetylase RimI-like enzyme|nr:GNAT family N-acetyltransferase [Chitinophagaceae bacterium]